MFCTKMCPSGGTKHVLEKFSGILRGPGHSSDFLYQFWLRALLEANGNSKIEEGLDM